MKFFIALCALVAVASADVSHLSNEYLPPVAASAPVAQYDSAPSYSVAASAPAVSYETTSYETAAAEPAHTFSSADGYRYKTAKRRVYRHRVRRDVSTEYLPPTEGAASAPSGEYLPPVAASAPVAQYESAPAVSSVSYDSAASEPAHSFSSADGYRYKTNRRRVYRQRRRRDVSHLSNEYLPPVAASAPVVQYESAPSYSVAASVPAVSYETASYETAPAHSFSVDDGYRYKTAKRRVLRQRKRREVSTEYLPPAASAPSGEYLPPVAQYESAPSYSVGAAVPAHSFSVDDGYRYKTAKRRVLRQRKRRDVSHLSNEYLPPVASSAPVVQYESAPSYSVAASVPAVSYETASYETAPAHSFSVDDGYRYKTAKRRVLRQRKRRDVSHLSNEYLPPLAGSASVAQYESVPSYSVAATAPVASYETVSYEPAHTFSSADGYRYKTAKRRVVRRHRF